MKTKRYKCLFKMFAFFGLVVFSLLLTSCGKEAKINWSNATEDNTMELALNVTTKNGQKVLKVTSEEVVFADNLQKEYFDISAMVEKKEENDDMSENLDVPETLAIIDYTLERIDGKSVKITVDSQERFEMVCMAIHSNAFTNKKYGEAVWINSTVLDSLEYEAMITDDFVGGEFDPVIHIILQNTALKSNITPEMITLNGAFANLDVLSINGSGMNLVLTTRGRITDDSYGIIHISGEALECGVALSASKGLLPSGALLDESTLDYKDGKVSFAVKLNNQKFTTEDKAELEKAIYGSVDSFVVESLESDKVVLSIPTTKTTLEEAITELRGLEFYIPGAKVSTGNTLKFIFSPHQAMIDMTFDTIEKVNDIYTGKAVFNALYGTLDDLSIEDFSFTEDFKGLTVTKLTKVDFYYEIEFTFIPQQVDFDLDDCYLAGEVQIPAEKIHTLWNSLGQNSCELEYFYNDEMTRDYDDNIDDLDSFVKNRVSCFTNLAKAIEKGGLSGSIDGAMAAISILKLTASSSGGKDASIKASINKIEKSVAKLSAKMDQQNITVRNSLNLIRSKIDETSYNNVCFYWNDYMTRYVGGLQKVMDDYCEIYRRSLIKFFHSPETNEIKIYIDENGNIVIPSLTENYSLDGTEIKKIITCVGDPETVKELSKVILTPMKNSLVNDYDKALKKAFLDPNSVVLVDAETDLPVIGLSGEAQYSAMLSYFSKLALDEVGVDNIITAFTAFCYRLGGGGDSTPAISAGQTYLDYFYQMLTLFYNFHSEAEEDAKTMISWLKALKTEAYSLALFAQAYTTNEKTIIDASDCFEKTIEQKLSGSHGEKTIFGGTDSFHDFNRYRVNYDYSYVADRDIYASYHDHVLYDGGSGADLPLMEYYSQGRKNSDESKVEYYGDYNLSQVFYGKLCVDYNAKIAGDDIVKPMYYRYQNMKTLKITKAANFTEYLVNAGILSANATNYTNILLSEKIEKIPFKADGSMTITCVAKGNGSKFFTYGEKTVIKPTKDASAKYFKDMYYDQALVMNAKTGEVKNTKTRAHALYIEIHNYWSYDELWRFNDYYFSGYVVLLVGAK